MVWGAVIMGATGILLWANNFFLSLVPKVCLDVATSVHFYEAMLAALAILVWHFYFVIFDPDVYPVDTTWITGKSVRQHHDEEVSAGEGKRGWREFRTSRVVVSASGCHQSFIFRITPSA